MHSATNSNYSMSIILTIVLKTPLPISICIVNIDCISILFLFNEPSKIHTPIAFPKQLSSLSLFISFPLVH